MAPVPLKVRCALWGIIRMGGTVVIGLAVVVGGCQFGPSTKSQSVALRPVPS